MIRCIVQYDDAYRKSPWDGAKNFNTYFLVYNINEGRDKFKVKALSNANNWKTDNDYWFNKGASHLTKFRLEFIYD